MTIDENRRNRLIEAALQALQQAYAPYSKYQVGAALEDTEGQVHTGCNIENVSYGLTNCAERVAVGAAVAGGRRTFQALAIAASGAVTPCGACRQVLAEFCQDLPIVLVDADSGPDAFRTVMLAELLPHAFRLPD